MSSFGEGRHTRILNLRDRWLAQGCLSAAWAHILLEVTGVRLGGRVRPFLVTSGAVLVAMVKLVVRMVDFISLGRIRAKPYIGITRLSQILQDSSASVASTALTGRCNYTRECNAL